MAGSNGNTKIIIIGLVLIVVGIIGYKSLQNENETEFTEDTGVSQTSDSVTDEASEFLEAALKNRILGDTNAPVKISEHSSLTCGHCGNFHKNTFEQFKKAYIDTGKAYLVYSDFPLNGPALNASMVARCLPEDKFFDYIQSLFVFQKDWAYERNYIDYLQKSSAEFGLSKEDFEACIENKELQRGLLAQLKAAQSQWNVNSTPTFVINNHKVISGAKTFEDFSKIIDEELAKVKKESNGQASEEETLNLNE